MTNAVVARAALRCHPDEPPGNSRRGSICRDIFGKRQSQLYDGIRSSRGWRVHREMKGEPRSLFFGDMNDH